MKKFAVIDIGSNSVRLMFVADGKVLYKALETTRLGEGLADSPYLKPSAIDRTAKAVAAFYQRALDEGAETIRVFATAAVRSSVNGGEFCTVVNMLCGAVVHVVSGEEEAELGILGALGNRDGAIIDIGGASTEIIVRKGGEILYKRSVDVGVVRLYDRCAKDLACLEEYCQDAVKLFGEVPQETNFYAIGGTATTIASLMLGQKQYNGGEVTGFSMEKQSLDNTVDQLVVTPVETLVEDFGVPKKRAEVLLGGGVWLKTIVASLGIEKVIASDQDNLEGYASKYGLL